MDGDMGETDFVKEVLSIAFDKNLGANVSVNILSKATPPSVPEHNADVIYAWCYSVMYDHALMSKCIRYAKVINELIKEDITPEIENMVLNLV